MKIAVLTLGCRTNQAESAKLEERLRASGHTTVSAMSSADIIIINSCSVTASADRQSRQLLSRAARTNAMIILTGCYSELNPDKLLNVTNITVVSNEQKDDIAQLIPETANNDHEIESDIRRHRPIIKVQDGCNNACSYCIIPLARGKSRSAEPDEVISEVIKYEQLGYHEIVLSGIHLGVYGHDLTPSMNLEKLLMRILKDTGINRIRLSSIELSEVTEGLLDLMTSDRICKHLHIPLQGGTDNILLNMGRSYTIGVFGMGIDRIVSKHKNIGIGTDVMVGFPGESSEEFEMSLSNISCLPFTYMHVFPFSKRPGAPAFTMSGQVDESTKKDRVRRMLDIALIKRVNFISKNIGVTHEIVVETVKNGIITGCTSNYIKVAINSDNDVAPGMLIKTVVAEGHALIASGIPL